jgi:hypothetical protein
VELAPVRRTRITATTTTAVFVLDGLAALGTGGLHAAAAEDGS